VADLTEAGQELLLARGGKGGLGNPHWQTSTHQTPYEHSHGEAGEEKIVRLDLKLIAGVGLVGFPNAGKSSLLGAISNAHPRVAPYAFTTLNPIIGTVKMDEFAPGFTVADIPGLVKGAHKGVGLGDRFLRHVERAACLAIVIDMAGSEGRDPVDDYETLVEELRLYRADLPDRKSVVVANKMDLPEARDNLQAFRKKTGLKPIPVSAVTGEGLETLKKRLHRIVKREE
jgi:GTP-binding protein